MTDFANEFGCGIICPFQRDGKGDFANGCGLPLLKSDIGELIGIMGPTATQPGELPWNMDLGSRVFQMKHRSMNVEMTRATAADFIEGPVRRWEKRARPIRTEVVADFQQNKLEIRFNYAPIGTDQGDSLSFTPPGMTG